MKGERGKGKGEITKRGSESRVFVGVQVIDVGNLYSVFELYEPLGVDL